MDGSNKGQKTIGVALQLEVLSKGKELGNSPLPPALGWFENYVFYSDEQHFTSRFILERKIGDAQLCLY